MAAARDPDSVYRELAPSVLGYLRSQVPTEAEDMLSDVFLAVVDGLDRFRGDDAALRRWVFTIAHHRVVDHHRRTHRRRTEVTASPPEPPSGDNLDMHLPADPVLLAALARLTPEQRQVVGLRLVADLPVSTVARLMHRRPDAIKALQSRALRRLAEELGET